MNELLSMLRLTDCIDGQQQQQQQQYYSLKRLNSLYSTIQSPTDC